MASSAKPIGVAYGEVSGSDQAAVTGTVTTTATTATLAADVVSLTTLLNEIRQALVNAKIIKGSA